ncbi:hypothetical protein [Carnimonas bestiolae]|uniref:hypothetical protein n=1 Tax=Carnimonas bestiolae TaxID=3402172 RepID=UPI003EDBB7E8
MASHTLSIRDKWALEEQLGQMLRDVDSQHDKRRDQEFQERLFGLMDTYSIRAADVVSLLAGDGS